MNAGAGVATEPTAPTADRLASALADALGTGLEARPLIEAAPATMLPAEGTADGVVVTLSGGEAHRALVVASPSLAAAGAGGGLEGLPSVLLYAAGSALAGILVAAVMGNEVTARTRFAFGPFLAFGLWLVWLYGPLT